MISTYRPTKLVIGWNIRQMCHDKNYGIKITLSDKFDNIDRNTFFKPLSLDLNRSLFVCMIDKYTFSPPLS